MDGVYDPFVFIKPAARPSWCHEEIMGGFEVDDALAVMVVVRLDELTEEGRYFLKVLPLTFLSDLAVL